MSAIPSPGPSDDAAPRPAALARIPAAAGRAALGVVADVRAILGTLGLTLRFLARRLPDRRAVVAEMFSIGNRSLFFVSVCMAFIGVIITFQMVLQALRLVPDLTFIGPTYAELLVRDLGASIAAMMLATRVGAGIASEIGSMAVTEQLDALRMSAAHPVEYLVVPRFVASIVMTVVLVVWATAIAFGAGMLAANVVFDINPHTFANFTLVDGGDVTIGVIKALAYGAAIPIVSAHRGLHARGGSEGVGTAATSAVVSSSLAVILLQFAISAVGYVVLP